MDRNTRAAAENLAPAGSPQGSVAGARAGTDAGPTAGHVPVMAAEAVRALVADRDGVFVDATFGCGGHAAQLLAQLSGRARLLVLDRDADAVAAAAAMAARDRRVIARQGAFGDLAAHLDAAGIGPPTGALFDVGLSSAQLADAERGFSFAREGPLDMRMDRSRGATAGVWLNAAREQEIAAVIRRYGEDHHAGRVARQVCRARPIETTSQLAAAVAQAIPSAGAASYARVFQAIRIHVNDELQQLRRGLEAAFAALAVGGRLAAITFHSLEHRLVRRLFRCWVAGPPVPPRWPAPVGGGLARYVAEVGKGCRPSAGELAANPRARSALLQVVEKAVAALPAQATAVRATAVRATAARGAA